MNDINSAIIQLRNKLDSLENENKMLEHRIKALEDKEIKQVITVEKTKAVKEKVIKPAGMPTAPQGVFFRYQSETKNAKAEIVENIKKQNPTLAPKEITKLANLKISERYYIEKGYAGIDEKGKPKGEIDQSKQSELMKKIISEHELAKKKYEGELQEFYKSEDGVKFLEENKKTVGKKGGKKKVTEKKPIPTGVPLHEPLNENFGGDKLSFKF